jgi:hypothetical protein
MYKPIWPYIKTLPLGAQVVEGLPTKCEALGSSPNTIKNEKKRKEKYPSLYRRPPDPK